MPQVVGRAFRDQPTAPDHADAITHALGLVEIVRGDEDGDALSAREIEQVSAKAGGGDGVEAGGGLVEEDHGWSMEERACERELLLHSPAPGTDELVAAFQQPEVTQQLDDPVVALVGWQVPEPSEVLEVVGGRETLVEPRMFQEHAALSAHRAPPSPIASWPSTLA